jgi:hypothetical protein
MENDGGSENERATLTVKKSTKERAADLKRYGLTWDAFLNDLLDCWEEADGTEQ